MNAPAAYVDLLEAVRILARTLPDGDRLAGAMTAAWITESLFRWNGNYPENDAEMVRLYGGDWRAWRERTRLAYGEACGILAAALRSGKVGGVGGPLGREVDGARE